jgi:hypothetical protein
MSDVWQLGVLAVVLGVMLLGALTILAFATMVVRFERSWKKER